MPRPPKARPSKRATRIAAVAVVGVVAGARMNRARVGLHRRPRLPRRESRRMRANRLRVNRLPENCGKRARSCGVPRVVDELMNHVHVECGLTLDKAQNESLVQREDTEGGETE